VPLSFRAPARARPGREDGIDNQRLLRAILGAGLGAEVVDDGG
jgi:hypothetical protein